MSLDAHKIFTGLTRRVSVTFNRQVRWSYLSIPLSHGSILMGGDDVFVEITPTSRCGLAVLANDSQAVFIGLVGKVVAITDVIDDNGAQVSHSLLGDCRQLCAILTELNRLDRSGKFPGFDTLSCVHIPQLDSIVCCSSSE